VLVGAKRVVPVSWPSEGARGQCVAVCGGTQGKLHRRQ
jgi:hypothetical protein